MHATHKYGFAISLQFFVIYKKRNYYTTTRNYKGTTTKICRFFADSV